MRFDLAAVVTATFAAAVLLTWVVRRVALRLGWMAVPNARSSHAVATAHGGGLAIVVATAGGLGALALLHELSLGSLALLAGGGAVVAAIGFVDDRYQLSARLRFAVHVAAALLVVVYFQGVPPLRLG